MTLYTGMLPSTSFKYRNQDATDLLAQMQHKPTTKRQADTQSPEKNIEEYPIWVALVWNNGQPDVRSSREAKDYRDIILDEVVTNRFRDVIHGFIEPKRRQKGNKVSKVHGSLPGNTHLDSYRRKASKRQHFGGFDNPHLPMYTLGEYLEPSEPPQLERKIVLPVNDKAGQTKWFGDAFKAVQQIGCRTIAKCWIKKIHPKKQSTHPYNGCLPRDAPPDANRTRPPYWPLNVTHKEPDHIDRNSRTNLLVHLIANTPHQQLKSSSSSVTIDEAVFIDARTLLQALEEKRADFKEDKWAIIQEVVKVRTQLESLVGQHCDDSMVIHVSDFTESARPRSDPDADDEEDCKEGIVDERQADANSASPQSDSALSPIDQLHQFAQPSMRAEQEAKDLPLGESETSLSVKPDLGYLEYGSRSIDSTAATQHVPMTRTNSLHPAYRDRYTKGVEAPYHRNSVPETYQQMAVTHAQRSPYPSNLQPTHDLMVQDWASHNSPTDFLPIEYTFNGVQCQTPIPHQTFRMAGAALAIPDQSTLGGHTPMLSTSPYQSMMATHTRPMPARTMSASHSAMMSYPVEGSNLYFDV